MGEPTKAWIGPVVIDCKNREGMISIWKQALGYEFRRRPDELPGNDWSLIADPCERGPNLVFEKYSDGPGLVYRFHFDLFSSDPGKKVQRLLDLGVTLVQPTREPFEHLTFAHPNGSPSGVRIEVITRDTSV